MEDKVTREEFAAATKEILKGCQEIQRQDGRPAISDEKIDELVLKVTDGKFGTKTSKPTSDQN